MATHHTADLTNERLAFTRTELPRIRLDLAHPQEKVWAALTTLDGITRWFGSHADGELTPGHDVRMRWEEYRNHTKSLAIKMVDPMSVFAYT